MLCIITRCHAKTQVGYAVSLLRGIRVAQHVIAHAALVAPLHACQEIDAVVDCTAVVGIGVELPLRSVGQRQAGKIGLIAADASGRCGLQQIAGSVRIIADDRFGIGTGEAEAERIGRLQVELAFEAARPHLTHREQANDWRLRRVVRIDRLNLVVVVIGPESAQIDGQLAVEEPALEARFVVTNFFAVERLQRAGGSQRVVLQIVSLTRFGARIGDIDRKIGAELVAVADFAAAKVIR